MADDPVPQPPSTPEERQAYDDMRATPNGILFDEDGNVVFDSYADATGKPGFKTRAEYDAAQARLEAALAEYRANKPKP
jgi:hypothetical protein